MAYFTPIFGGMIADRWLGKRRAVIIGGSIMAAGHFMMTFEPLFYPALATIALGNGLFLPSLPSQINDLYRPDDPRRGWAYNVYYVGINIGGFLAPLVCGTLGEFYGWHWGFGAAGVGMLTGLLVYVFGGEVSARAGGALRAKRQRRPHPPAAIAPRSCCCLQSVSPSRYFAVPTSRWATRWRCGRMSASIARPSLLTIPMTWFQSLNPLLVIADDAAAACALAAQRPMRDASRVRCAKWRSAR